MKANKNYTYLQAHIEEKPRDLNLRAYLTND